MQSKSITLLLVAICTILGNMIYYKYKHPQEYHSSSSTNSTENLSLTKVPEMQEPELADISDFDEIIQRPLFSTDRQVAEEIAEDTPVQKPARNPDLQLTGIVLSDEEQVALIKSKKQAKLQRVKLNENILGWKLIELNNSSVKLKSGRQEITLDLSRKTDPVKARQLTKQQTIQQKLKNNNQNIPGKNIPGTPTSNPADKKPSESVDPPSDEDEDDD